jgi:hypothetical protein
VLSQSGEGKVFKEWVGEASVFGVEILPQPSERLCTQNLAGTLHTDGVGSMLSVGREVKMEIPVKIQVNPVMSILKSRRGQFWALACLVLFAVGLFRYRVRYDSTDIVPREEETFQLARNIAETGQFANPFVSLDTGPSAHLAPAFPAFLALIMKVFGDRDAGIYSIRLAASLVLCLEVALFPVFSSALGMGNLNGMVAAIVWIVAKVGLESLGHQALAMYAWEAFYAALLIAIIVCYCRRYLDSSAHDSTRLAWPIGVLLGVLALTSPTAGIVFVGWAAWIAWRERLTTFRKSHLLVVLLPALMVAPWMIRNYLVFDRIIFVRDNFGLELSVSNNDCAVFGIVQNRQSGCFAKVHPNANIDEARKVLAYGEPKYNDLKLREARSWIENHPARFLELSAVRFAAFWLPPANEGPFTLLGRGGRLQRLAIGIMTLLSIPGLFILWRRDTKSAVLCSLCLILFPLIYYIVQHDDRYRYPILWVTFFLGSLPITNVVRPMLKSLNFGRTVSE